MEEVDEESNNKNFMTRLYEDEKFVREKTLLEEQIIKASEATQESKSFIREMDDFLKDLQTWKTKRQVVEQDVPDHDEESKQQLVLDEGTSSVTHL